MVLDRPAVVYFSLRHRENGSCNSYFENHGPQRQMAQVDSILFHCNNLGLQLSGMYNHIRSVQSSTSLVDPDNSTQMLESYHTNALQLLHGW